MLAHARLAAWLQRVDSVADVDVVARAVDPIDTQHQVTTSIDDLRRSGIIFLSSCHVYIKIIG